MEENIVKQEIVMVYCAKYVLLATQIEKNLLKQKRHNESIKSFPV